MSAPTGTVTLVFTGIENSGELWERLGAAFEPVLALHQRAIREALAARGGYEVKVEGDAFMLSFARATEAMQFAQEAQEGLARQPWPASTGEIRVRMGVRTGVPICAPDPAGRMDCFGPVVNRAARIAAAAHGGQILISEAARAAAREALETAAGNLDEAHAAVGSGSALVTALGLDRVSGAPDVAAFQAVRRRLLR